MRNFLIKNGLGVPNGSVIRDVFTENTIIMNIYYSDLQYEEISESPKHTVTDLISNIGGTMGIKIQFFHFFLIINFKSLFFYTLNRSVSRCKSAEHCRDFGVYY